MIPKNLFPSKKSNIHKNSLFIKPFPDSNEQNAQNLTVLQVMTWFLTIFLERSIWFDRFNKPMSNSQNFSTSLVRSDLIFFAKNCNFAKMFAKQSPPPPRPIVCLFSKKCIRDYFLHSSRVTIVRGKNPYADLNCSVKKTNFQAFPNFCRKTEICWNKN